MELKPLDKDDIEGIVREAITNAVDFVESNISSQRIKAQRYFDGLVDIGEEEGRSKVVATKVRDTIRAIKPSLMRVFLNTDKPVEYVPRGPEDAMTAEQATNYMHWRFNEEGGYRIISSAFHDALVKKQGVVKVYWDTVTTTEIYEYNGLNDQEYSLIVNEPDIEVLEHAQEMSMEMDMNGMQIEMPEHYIKVARTCEDGKLCLESVPPEEFFVDDNARSIEDAYVVAHRTQMRVSDLVAMGYDFDEVSESINDGDDTIGDMEDFYRRGYQDDNEESSQDPSMKMVMVTEAYMKLDVDGTGYPMMHKILTIGGSYKLLDYERWGETPFAVFEIDPEPHSFYGRSIADLLINEQDAATAMIRGVLDNVALTNNPRKTVLDGAVNIDDLLNNEVGAVVRVKQMGAMEELVTPFVAAQTLPALQYLDQEIESKTGVTRASAGLSPDALQSTTAAAVSATIQAAAGQVEVMCRNLAEGGMRRLFKLMLKLTVENVEEQQMMKLSGQGYVPVDPRSWNNSMDVSVNVGLGTGREEQRTVALQQALQMQMQVFQGYGPQNGVVTLTNIRNTLADLLALNGVRNADRYFAQMNPEIEQQMMQAQQQAAQGQQPQMDQATAYLQAEQMKAQTKQQELQMKMMLEAQKAAATDDRERDKMDQDLLIKAAEILGKYGAAVDVAQVKTLQNQPRALQSSQVPLINGQGM